MPFVRVNLWYDVGSKDGKPGRTGFAQLFEHLMFQGSEHYNDDYFKPLQAVGAQINGTTNFDRTNYFEGVPAEHLPMALFMESDRMGYLLPALTEERLDNQRDVVRNERRQRYENRPYGMVWVWLFETLYPEGHPYHVPTIGKHEDLGGRHVEDTKEFFATWYVPNNATLTVAGDFDLLRPRPSWRSTSDPSPAESSPRRRQTLPTASTARSSCARRQARAVREGLGRVAHTQGLRRRRRRHGHRRERAERRQRPRLYSKLVKELQVAKDVSCFQYSTRLQGQFLCEATATQGRPPTPCSPSSIRSWQHSSRKARPTRRWPWPGPPTR